MNEPSNVPDNEPEAPELHLGKFAPRQPGEPPTSNTPGGTEGPTMFIRKAAAETVEQSGQSVAVPQQASALPPKNLLGAVAYCYAKGVYRSEDIAREMRQDPALKAVLKDQIPDAQAIRRFRRLNREAIQVTLEKFYRWLRKQEATTEALSGPMVPPGPGRSKDSDKGNTTFLAKRQASDRLDLASWIDNMSKEE